MCLWRDYGEAPVEPILLQGEGIGWCRGAFVDITEDEMKAATQQATGEPAGHSANQLTVATTSGKAPFRLPSGFSKQKGSPARNPRVEYRQAQRLRADQSMSMAEKFPQLKGLKVALEFVDREGMTKTTEMKYTANPEHAKSVLVFVCPSPACWGRGF